MREDGGGESVLLETRGLLVHDFAHFAFETEARLSRSFYGLLASGASLADVGPEADRFPTKEAELTERIVGPLTGVLSGRTSVEGFFDGFGRLQDAMGERTPDWLTHDLVARTADRFVAVHGRWRATPFHATLTLKFVAGGAQ